MTTKVIPIHQFSKRECGECTRCCEGWLYGEAYGHQFDRGHKCHFLLDKCSIYEHRPEDPCKIYSCEWLRDNYLPIWFRPDKVNMIVTKRQHEGMDFLDAADCGEIKSSDLSFIVQYALANNINLIYSIDGIIFSIGTNEFRKINFTRYRV